MSTDQNPFAAMIEEQRAVEAARVTQVNIYKSGASWFGARWAGAEFDGCDPIEADDEAEAIAQACLEFPGANITRVDYER